MQIEIKYYQKELKKKKKKKGSLPSPSLCPDQILLTVNSDTYFYFYPHTC